MNTIFGMFSILLYIISLAFYYNYYALSRSDFCTFIVFLRNRLKLTVWNSSSRSAKSRLLSRDTQQPLNNIVTTKQAIQMYKNIKYAIIWCVKKICTTELTKQVTIPIVKTLNEKLYKWFLWWEPFLFEKYSWRSNLLRSEKYVVCWRGELTIPKL